MAMLSPRVVLNTLTRIRMFRIVMAMSTDQRLLRVCSCLTVRIFLTIPSISPCVHRPEVSKWIWPFLR